jgi:23S rRNA (uracil1939-C5)-methyltransferase
LSEALVELEIERLAAGGDGVGRLDGLAVFVPRTAPGDRVRARIVERRRRFARAECVELLEPGPDRREPPCPYYADCGGCAWMHLEEPAQQRAKLEIVRDALRRIGGVDVPDELRHIPSPRAFGYRSRARVAYDAGRVGFRARASHQVIDIERCAVLDPATQAALERLRTDAPRGTGEVQLRGFGDRVEIAGRTYLVGPDAFFQANASLWEMWLDQIGSLCGSGELAVELYAGVGFYTAVLQQHFEQVLAVERGAAAHDLARNTSARVIQASAESWAKKNLAGLAPDLVVVNPPRTGCDRRVIEAIARSGARRFLYISCDPATLARDVARLGDAYHAREIVVLDALPQTEHVECIALLDLA